MQALQAAPPGAPLPLDGEPPDPFWEAQNHTDLDGFLCSLLAEGQVELTAHLVPPTLAASFGLSTDSNNSSQVVVPRATAAALRTRSAPTGRGQGVQPLVPVPGTQAAQQHQTQQAAAAAGRRGQRTTTPPSHRTEQHPQQMPMGTSLDPGAATAKGEQPSGAPVSVSGLLAQQAAALAAGTEQQPRAAHGGGPSSNPFSSDPPTQQPGEVQCAPHLRYDFLQAQQDQAAVVAQFQQQQQQAQAAAMYAQQQAFQQQQFAAQQAFQAQMEAQQQQQQQVAAGGGSVPKGAEGAGEAGGGAAGDAAASFYQRQQQAAAAAYGQFQNPWAANGWGGMYGGYPGQFGGYPGQQFGGYYPPYQGQMGGMGQMGQVQQQMGGMGQQMGGMAGMQFPGMPPFPQQQQPQQQQQQQQQQQGGGGGMAGFNPPLGSGGLSTMLSLPLPIPGGALPSPAQAMPQEVVQQSEGLPGNDDDPCALKKPRLIWTTALHKRFMEALDKVGGVDRALPKAVMREMGVAGLTRENVASHLQKHRMRLKKEEDEAGGHHAPAASGPADHKRAAAAAEAEALRKQRPRRAAAAGAAAAAAAAAAIVPELSQVSDGRTAEGGA